VKPDIWESLEALEGQHWVTSSFKGRGDLEFSGQLRFSGEWTGTVHSGPDDSALFVLSGAIICGRIRVDEITVAGTLQDVDVEVRVFRALKGARVFGRVRAEVLLVEDGALVQGEIQTLKR
jgi:cytoskeletal protein CcmA (bactofilin family)